MICVLDPDYVIFVSSMFLSLYVSHKFVYYHCFRVYINHTPVLKFATVCFRSKKKIISIENEGNQV